MRAKYESITSKTPKTIDSTEHEIRLTVIVPKPQLLLLGTQTVKRKEIYAYKDI